MLIGDRVRRLDHLDPVTGVDIVVGMIVLGHYQRITGRQIIERTPAHPNGRLAHGKHQIRSEGFVFGQCVGDCLVTRDRIDSRLPDLL